MRLLVHRKLAWIERWGSRSLRTFFSRLKRPLGPGMVAQGPRRRSPIRTPLRIASIPGSGTSHQVLKDSLLLDFLLESLDSLDSLLTLLESLE